MIDLQRSATVRFEAHGEIVDVVVGGLLNEPATCSYISRTDLCKQLHVLLQVLQQIRLTVLPRHSLQTPGQTVLSLTLQNQAPSREATGAPPFGCVGNTCGLRGRGFPSVTTSSQRKLFHHH